MDDEGQIAAGIDNLDKAMAIFLLQPSSPASLALVRVARSIKMIMKCMGRPDDQGFVEALYEDAKSLHQTVIVLESDPEAVRMNSLARILTGIGPSLNIAANLRSRGKEAASDILKEIASMILEVGAATQYLDSTRLSAKVHFEQELLELEECLIQRLEPLIGDPFDRAEKVAEFCDGLRSVNKETEEKVLTLFIMRIFIAILSYKSVKGQFTQ